jgi:hypothetical protein
VQPGFTIGANQDPAVKPVAGHPHVEPGLLWSSGIANVPTANVSWSYEIITNQLHVIRALVSCLTGQVYQTRMLVRDQLRSVLTSSQCPHAATLVASLLGVVCNYVPAGSMPYTSHMVNDSEELVYRAAQLLLLVLDHDMYYEMVETRADEEYDDEGSPVARPPKVRVVPRKDGAVNVGLHAAWGVVDALTAFEIEFVILGMTRLLLNNTAAKTTLLPNTQRAMPCREEMIILFWKLVDKSAAFRTAFVASPSAVKVLLPLLDFAFQGRDEATRGSCIQVVVLILLRLSCERQWCVALNEPFYGKVPYLLQTFTGSHADLLFMTLHSLLVCKNEWVRAVHNSFLVIMCNVSPFMTAVCPLAAVKLVNLLEYFSGAAWLQRSPEAHPRMLDNLCLVIANLLQYQFLGATHLLYSLVRKAPVVKALLAAVQDHTLPVPQDVADGILVFTLACAIDAVEAPITKALALDANFDVQKHLEGQTLVGRLPVPHRIVVQEYTPRVSTDHWVVSWTWSMLYIHAFPHFIDGTAVKLFSVKPVARYPAPPPAGPTPAQ